MEHLTMPSSVTEDKELTGSRRSLLDETHKHLISLPVLHNLGNHVWHGDFTEACRGWRISIVE
jgi:hypothetical protein